ncbi:MAG: DNA helicase RecQ [Caldilineaceae bacterium]
MSTQNSTQSMKVVIVAKTRQGGGVGVDALTFTGRSVRLLHPNPDSDSNPNMEYEVGDVWEIVWQPSDERALPHSEDITVLEKRRLAPIDDLFSFVHYHLSPQTGGIEALYDGLLQTTKKGALYIAEHTGVPEYSTTFWMPDQPLRREAGSKRLYYRYPTVRGGPTEDGGRTLTFVGFQEPLEEIPAGTLLRVSLAHWWRPDEMPAEMPEGELRCYVQLSGWILPGATDSFYSDEWEHSQPVESEPAPPRDAPSIPPPPAVSLPPTLDSARTLLKQVFGYDDFRPLQAEVMGNVLGRRDTLAIMPTGSGKSLCYQIPGLIFPGLTVVVSPLISLMQDQVEALRDADVAAAYLNSSLAYHEYDFVVEQVRQGRVKLLYVAPETLLLPATLALLDACQVDCLTIDEAHCISQWGHDFRPEYRQIVDVRRRLPAAVCIAATATATPRVQSDIKQSLGFGESDTFLASFDRPNLFLGVQPRQDGPGQVLSFIEDHKEQSGIVYCSTRKEVDSLAALLQRREISALPYHAGLDSHTRAQNQRAFVRDQVSVMVATVAFGMGIDKPDVRFIIHYSLPQDMESYYQQIGRAGRDSLRADCLLLFNYADLRTIRFFIGQQAPAEQQGANVRLSAMIGFGETDECRRVPLLGYFGEIYTAGPDDDGCAMCDNCTAEERAQVDLTIPAQKFLSCVYRTKQRFGMAHIIDVLRGSRAKKVLQFQHDKLSTYNIGAEFSKQEWSYLARLFIQKGLLDQDITHGSLSLTDSGWAVLRSEQRLMGALQPREQAGPAITETVEHDTGLFQQLRALRRELADAAGLPPYMVFGDRSLMEMAAFFPHSRESFLQMHGVGQAKAERYADAFLAAIQTYCAENDLAEKPKSASTGLAGVASSRRSSGSASTGSRTHEIAAAFDEGHSIAQIAQETGVARRTVIGHLWKYLQAGHTLNPVHFRRESNLDAAVQEQVLAAFAEHGPDFLRPVYDALGETVDWDDLHIMRLWFASER